MTAVSTDTPITTSSPKMEETLNGVPVSFSASSGSWNVRFAQGGKSAGQGQLAANHPHGMHEREPVGILARFQRRFMHQPPHGKVRQQQRVEFLPHQVGRLASQDDLRSP